MLAYIYMYIYIYIYTHKKCKAWPKKWQQWRRDRGRRTSYRPLPGPHPPQPHRLAGSLSWKSTAFKGKGLFFMTFAKEISKSQPQNPRSEIFFLPQNPGTKIFNSQPLTLQNKCFQCRQSQSGFWNQGFPRSRGLLCRARLLGGATVHTWAHGGQAVGCSWPGQVPRSSPSPMSPRACKTETCTHRTPQHTWLDNSKICWLGASSWENKDYSEINSKNLSSN